MTTASEWPLRNYKHYPLDNFQTPTKQSLDPDTKNYPFLEKATLCTSFKCPLKVFNGLIEATFHKIIVLS